MPGNGPHRLEFVGKTPWIFMLLAVLLIINSLAGIVFLPALSTSHTERFRTTVTFWKSNLDC